MALLGFELLFRFMWGSLFVLTFVSRTETSERFTRIASYIAVGSALFAAYLLGSGVSSAGDPSVNVLVDPRFFGLVALTIGSLLYSHTRRRTTRILGATLYVFSAAGVLWRAPILEFVNFATSALVIGSVFAGQYLGHWFLTVPGLHIRELQRVVRFLFIALGLKSLEVGVSLLLHTSVATSTIDIFGRPLGLDLGPTRNLMQLDVNSTFFSLDGDVFMGFGLFGFILFLTRVLWGLVAPLVLAVMIKKTVDMRSTQSATGILYALCVMIIVGEGAALYLKMAMGIYL